MKIKGITIVSSIVLALTAILCNAEDAFATKKVFTGIVKPIITQDIQYGYNDGHRGIIDYTAATGSLFFAPIYDSKGGVIKEGTTLIHMKTTYREMLVSVAEASLEQALAATKIAKINYERNEKLQKKHSVSEADYLNSQATYLQTVAVAESAKATLKIAVEMLQICTLKASYDGYVEQVYFPFGLAAGELKVLRLSMLNPIGVNVIMDRNTAVQINRNTPITIYPVNSDKPFGVFHGTSGFTSDGIVLGIANVLCDPPVNMTVNGKRIPLISQTSTVIGCTSENPNIQNKLPMVFSEYILSDDKGSYVWKLVGEENNVPGQGLHYISTVEKIYIQATENASNSSYLYMVLDDEDASRIQPGNILISAVSVPEGLQNGDSVCVSTNKYVFMPGDPVRVEIGPNPGKIQ